MRYVIAILLVICLGLASYIGYQGGDGSGVVVTDTVTPKIEMEKAKVRDSIVIKIKWIDSVRVRDSIILSEAVDPKLSDSTKDSNLHALMTEKLKPFDTITTASYKSLKDSNSIRIKPSEAYRSIIAVDERNFYLKRSIEFEKAYSKTDSLLGLSTSNTNNLMNIWKVQCDLASKAAYKSGVKTGTVIGVVSGIAATSLIVYLVK